MKTPEEIKKGLEFCTRERHSVEPLCDSCPYDDGGFDMVKCTGHLSQDALAYIQQLEAESSRKDDTINSLTELLNAAHEETAAIKRERDAAVDDLELCGLCKVCKHMETKCNDCRRCKLRIAFCDKFEWRGVCPDTEVQTDE